MLGMQVKRMAISNKKQSSGFSLVELLVAMAVGVIIISGAFSLHLATRKTQVKNEEQMDKFLGELRVKLKTAIDGGDKIEIR